jgi:L-asparaginase II
MSQTYYEPVFELTRGQTVESVHFGAIAVVDSEGRLLAHYGNPAATSFLRSSAKPFQALPLIERQGHVKFGLDGQEIAITCASHSGTPEHVSVIKSIQQKTGFDENDLMCGIHFPLHEATANEMRALRESPTPNQHNCSGKHSGMLALVRLTGYAGVNQAYIDPEHPIQMIIKGTFADMCRLPEDAVAVGIDGCSAPNFAVPLLQAAWGFARLCDPQAGEVEPVERLNACQTITSAMWNFPEMVGGPGRFDTRLMQVGGGRWIAKGGAEGYQGIGIFRNSISPNSPAFGIALKISDGDSRGRIGAAVGVEVLRQLGVLSRTDLEALADFGPSYTIRNWRKLHVGEGRPVFELIRT